MSLRTFKIARIGTKDVTIEQAPDARGACWKAGWDPDKCETQDITDELTEAKRNGTYRIYDTHVSQDRLRQIEDMFRDIARESIIKVPAGGK